MKADAWRRCERVGLAGEAVIAADAGGGRTDGFLRELRSGPCVAAPLVLALGAVCLLCSLCFMSSRVLCVSVCLLLPAFERLQHLWLHLDLSLQR